MSWDGYIGRLMVSGMEKDAVIVGLESKTVWAHHPGSYLRNITPAEVALLSAPNRDGLLTNGITLAGRKCSVIRDRLDIEDEHTMDLRTKADGHSSTTFNIAIAKSLQTLVMVEGKEGIHGGLLNKTAFDVADYLRKAGY
ncbi:profilin-1-like [Petromyzon marinus]|uniref:Profilin n=1 Tax=Petromyzon marinus TaxID=7757 RepID=A0AAJ7UEJ3_PETMA|nr:profilin-1-like [Petromyzon marinus]